MISLYYQTDNTFSRYGINHFIEKSGIPFQINKPSQSGIVIAYGCEARGDFVIAFEENEIHNTVCGKISTPSEKIPLCEIPQNTGPGGKPVAYFKTDTTEYPCVTQKDRGISIGVDIFKETGYLLSGHLDFIRPSLDKTMQKDLASKPVVDFLENILFNAILEACSQQKIPLVQKSYWPEGKTFAVCLTHDVDELKKTYQWFTRPVRFLLKGDMGGFKGQIQSFFLKIKGKEPYNTFEDIINIEREFKAKSTYFILKESGHARLSSKKTWYLYGRNRSFQSKTMRSLIQRLKSNGDEIAVHGSYFSFNDPVLLHEETRELEQLINAKILGTRQHNLNLEIPATWKHQVSAGLHYDTTLGFKDTIGFRWGTSSPFFPGNEEKTIHLVEIPLIIMDICLESRKNQEAECIEIADEVERYHGVLTLLWHPPSFNTCEYGNAREIYININHYCREKGAWIARSGDIYEWFSLRNQQAFSCSCQGSTFKIIPSDTNSDLYLTIHFPRDMKGTIRSENADIIGKAGSIMFIKGHHLNNNKEIIIDLA